MESLVFRDLRATYLAKPYQDAKRREKGNIITETAIKEVIAVRHRTLRPQFALGKKE